jgi:hypothetical protein
MPAAAASIYCCTLHAANVLHIAAPGRAPKCSDPAIGPDCTHALRSRQAEERPSPAFWRISDSASVQSSPPLHAPVPAKRRIAWRTARRHATRSGFAARAVRCV